ncbi:hypothetical protein CHARACLAT_033491 [Characodon lateralis]|uniref:Uncharacterized protein n=1 Tax=Characodon lateralis TaxID=208331 RepID=A0ABU7EPJ7_9TELE|nr:hypothetical protein [Characodon lateralis]
MKVFCSFIHPKALEGIEVKRDKDLQNGGMHSSGKHCSCLVSNLFMHKPLCNEEGSCQPLLVHINFQHICFRAGRRNISEMQREACWSQKSGSFQHYQTWLGTYRLKIHVYDSFPISECNIPKS